MIGYILTVLAHDTGKKVEKKSNGIF